MNPAESRAATDRSLWLFCGALLSLAALYRVRALSWGAPYVYHADEHYIVHGALRLVRERTLDPDFFQYPSFLIYAEAVLVAVLQSWLQVDLRTDAAVHGIGPWDVAPEQFPFVFAGRILVATMGIVSVVAAGLLWRGWLGPIAGWVAALLLAVSPLHVESSHYLTTDVPATFWVLCALALSARVSEPRNGHRWSMLAGASAGLAAASKYPAGIVLIPVLAGAASSERWVRRMVLVGACFVAAFVLASPFVVLRPIRALEDLAIVRSNYGSAPSPWGNFEFFVTYLWRTGVGPVGSVLALLGWIYCWRGSALGNLWWRASILLVPWLYLAYLSTWLVRFERNLLPIVPFVLLWIGVASQRLLAALPVRLQQIAAFGLALAIALPLGRASEQLVRRLALPDTRTRALEWIHANVPPGAHLAREEYTPQVSGKQYRVTYVQLLGLRPYSWYVANGVEYLVASSLMYERGLHAPALGEFYRFVFQQLPLEAEFRPDAITNGPTIRIYRVPLWRENDG